MPEDVKGEVTVHVTSLETTEEITVEDVTFTIDENAPSYGF
ncbi:MAG: hypothetical protein ACYDCO_23785 [Armatimonadota bacterium]